MVCLFGAVSNCGDSHRQVGAFGDYTAESGGGDDGGDGAGASEAAAGDAEADQVRHRMSASAPDISCG